MNQSSLGLVVRHRSHTARVLSSNLRASIFFVLFELFLRLNRLSPFRVRLYCLVYSVIIFLLHIQRQVWVGKFQDRIYHS